MQANISSPIAANEIGWLRYNYSQNRLEFINNETRTIIQVWEIPIDQWENIPSKREYCESIINNIDQYSKQKRKTKSSAIGVLFVSVVVSIICWAFLYDYLYEYEMFFGTNYNVVNCVAGCVAIISAVTSLFKIKQ